MSVLIVHSTQWFKGVRTSLKTRFGFGLVGCGLTLHSAIFQLYCDGTGVFFSVLKLIEMVILWVYYTIPFGLSLFRPFWGLTFHNVLTTLSG